MPYSKFRRRYKADDTVPTAWERGQCSVERSELGIVYLAMGEEHMRLTTLSISFLRRFGYSGPIRVVTDAKDWPIADHDFEIVPIGSVGPRCAPRFYKTQINRFGFPATLFLDADMLPIAPVDPIWDDLRLAELCVSLELPRVRNFIEYYWQGAEPMRPELTYMIQSGLAEHPFFNSGLILFRQSPVVDQLFEIWHEEWRRFGGRDQCALVRAVARTGITLHTLPICWNCPPRRFQSIEEAQNVGIRILHFFSGEQRLRLPKFVEGF